MSIHDEIDKALASGGKSAFNAESRPGDKVRGPIASIDYRQVTDYNSGKPAEFPSGDPKMQFIVNIATQLRDPDNADDDGIRAVYISNWGKRKIALQEAIRNAGAKKGSEVLREGVVFEVEYLGEQRADGGPSGSYSFKAFRYAFDRASASAADELTSAAAAFAGATATPPTVAPAPDLSVCPPGANAATWAGMSDEQKLGFLAVIGQD